MRSITTWVGMWCHYEEAMENDAFFHLWRLLGSKILDNFMEFVRSLRKASSKIKLLSSLIILTVFSNDEKSLRMTFQKKLWKQSNSILPSQLVPNSAYYHLNASRLTELVGISKLSKRAHVSRHFSWNISNGLAKKTETFLRPLDYNQLPHEHM